ncbi:MAG: hypothetical protein JSS49_06320 [Planctomycetes bacterium]|nr:hypothetical protein [Planctomycetota bacterium]
MATSQFDRPAEADLPFAEVPPDPQVIRHRRVVRIVVGGVLAMVVVAAAQAVGPDLMITVRRWKALRSIAASSTNPALSPSQQAVSAEIPRIDPAFQLPADAQISPPKRKIRVAESVTSVIPEAAIDFVPNESEPVTMDLPANADQPVNVGSDAPADRPLDSNEALLETAAQLVNQSWQDFAYPVHWPASETSKTRMQYNHHRNRLLKAIAHPSPNTLSLDMARKDYSAARVEFPEDPRLDYAFGLVLWKHGQTGEAIDMFQTAGCLESAPFLPAALAVAWGRMLNHDERRGLDQLVHIARVLAVADGVTPPESQQQQAALSMGRAIGYLSGPGAIPELAESVQLTSINIRERLPERLRDTYDSGRDQAGQRQSELLQLTDLPRDRIQSDHQSRQSELQNRINELRQQMKDSRNALSRSHLSSVDRIKDVLKEALDIRAQMERLRPTAAKLKESLWTLNQPEQHTETKTMPGHMHMVETGRPSEVQLVQNNATFSFIRGETASERAARVSRLNKVRDDLKKIDEDLAKLRVEQQDLLSRRRLEDRQHQREKEAARMERVSRLQEQRDLEKKLHQLNNALRRTLNLREGVDTIAAYIPWNVEVEGEALWLALKDGTPQQSR